MENLCQTCGTHAPKQYSSTFSSVYCESCILDEMSNNLAEALHAVSADLI